MEQRHRAFRLPTSVASTMERKRKLLETGEVESPTCVPDSVFCRMITSKEYNRQRVEFTQHHISELARALATNQSNIAPKKKKEILKKLQATHSSAYERSRGPMRVPHVHPVSPEPPLPPKPTPSVFLRAPSSDPLSRRRNKARRNQTYL
nr:uncharacterized protein LOC113475285 [Ciona intestinalis]|eukprot:XP_026695072.1 uncharacterized protein LOC113475285 [Ciona intestinalis]